MEEILSRKTEAAFEGRHGNSFYNMVDELISIIGA